jgi:hypothetical protein
MDGNWIYLCNWELCLGVMRLQTRHIVVDFLCFGWEKGLEGGA